MQALLEPCMAVAVYFSAHFVLDLSLGQVTLTYDILTFRLHRKVTCAIHSDNLHTKIELLLSNCKPR